MNEILRKQAGKFWSLFEAASAATNVPAILLAAMAKQESSFNPAAVNNKSGAEGLMQLEPMFYKEINPFDPAQAIEAAAESMAHYKRIFGTWSLALAAYNWGPGNLSRWQASGAKRTWWPLETQRYVERIMRDAC